MTSKIWIFIIVVSFTLFQATNGSPTNEQRTSSKEINETALYIGKNSIFFVISVIYICNISIIII